MLHGKLCVFNLGGGRTQFPFPVQFFNTLETELEPVRPPARQGARGWVSLNV